MSATLPIMPYSPSEERRPYFTQDPLIESSSSHSTTIDNFPDNSKIIVCGNGGFMHSIQNIYNRIVAAQPPYADQGQDCLAWKHTNDGTFSVASAYEVLSGQLNLQSSRLAKLVWDWKCPMRLNLFLWRVVNDALPTNV